MDKGPMRTAIQVRAHLTKLSIEDATEVAAIARTDTRRAVRDGIQAWERRVGFSLDRVAEVPDGKPCPRCKRSDGDIRPDGSTVRFGLRRGKHRQSYCNRCRHAY